MASFDAVNYSLRPSKSIQRSLVFDDVRRLQSIEAFVQNPLVYVGFGSIWFVDFLIAHRSLGAADLISVESDAIGFRRAEFNKPFSCVTVLDGHSGIVLPDLYSRPELQQRPWMMWLDYDYEFDESVREDVQLAVERLPADSVFLVTVNATPSKYGQRPRDREERLRTLFGDAVPATVTRSQLDREGFSELLKTCVMDYMTSVVFERSRPGGFHKAFSIAYKDQAPMITVGGILPSESSSGDVKTLITSTNWKSLPVGPVAAPHLTAKEAASLQSQLPHGLDRPKVQGLGFDLDEDQIEAFKQYYLFYPNYAQVLA